MTLFLQGAASVNGITETSVKSSRRTTATNEKSFAKSFGRCAYQAVMRAAQGFFERKKRSAAEELRLASGHPLRTVQTWFQDKHQGSATALIALLATDAAPVVLATIRAELKSAGKIIPKFYDDFEAFVAVRAAMRAHDELKKQAEELRRLNDKL